MDLGSEDWSGLTVRTRDGTVLGVVVGVFAEGLLAGRLRVSLLGNCRWLQNGPGQPLWLPGAS
jgi:hypothetical protein